MILQGSMADHHDGCKLILWLILQSEMLSMTKADNTELLGKIFKMYKLKTIKSDGSISLFGRFLRKSKIDELPQFLNVFIGDMSIVGPRPDISGYYDLLEGQERDILKLKPGITSSASLKYVNEETILQQQTNPQKYNDEVIFKDKVKT